MAKVTRRDFVRSAAIGGAGVVGLGGVVADANGQAGGAKTDEKGKVTPEQISGSDALAGRTTSDAEKTQMAATLAEIRDGLLAIRTHPKIGSLAPSVAFDPVPPGKKAPFSSKSPTRAPGISRRPEAKYDGNVESLAFLPVAELAKLVKSRKVSSVALTQMYLSRLKKFGPRLLCVVSLLEERALAQASRADLEIRAGKYRGPLHGIPYGVKDLFDALGTVTTFGAPPFKNRRSVVDSTVVSRLDEAGAILCAKLSMGELAMGDVWFGGVTRNPWDSAVGSSGSSAGSASAVAAGLLGFAIGTETYGSIVSPSVRCGATGLRPTFGRVSRHGAMALSWTMDKIGPIARGVEDCALVFAAIHGPDGLDTSLQENVPFEWKPGARLSDLRVGVDTSAFEKASDAHKAVLETLKTLGVTTKPIALPKNEPGYEAIVDCSIFAEGAASFAELAARGGLSDLVQQGPADWHNLFRVGATIPASDYLQAQRLRRELQARVAESLDGIDVYVTPAASQPSLQHANLCGYPTVVTRCGKNDRGLPVSIEFVGNLFREDAALRLAHAFERATTWHTLWPETDKLPETPPALRRGR